MKRKMTRLVSLCLAVVAFACMSSSKTDKGNETTPQAGSSKNKPDAKKKDKVVTVKTEFGEIVLLLHDATPTHKANFLKLAEDGFYNGTTFHRIIDGFMIQGGDPNSKDNIPTNDGGGGPGYTLPAEIVPSLTHKYGAVAAARLGDNVNPSRASNGSQFYIVENKDGAHFLDQQYTVFGQVVQGMEVVEQIAVQPKDPRDRPLKNITMEVSVKEMNRDAIEKKYNVNFYE